jgi:hypothetical protein
MDRFFVVKLIQIISMIVVILDAMAKDFLKDSALIVKK